MRKPRTWHFVSVQRLLCREEVSRRSNGGRSGRVAVCCTKELRDAARRGDPSALERFARSTPRRRRLRSASPRRNLSSPGSWALRAGPAQGGYSGVERIRRKPVPNGLINEYLHAA